MDKIKSKIKEYNPEDYFNSWYNSFDEISDRITISPNSSIEETIYHYNCVENSILEIQAEYEFGKNPSIIDLGSGYGHWVKFFLKLYPETQIRAYDISQKCVDTMNDYFKKQDNIKFLCDDFSSADFEFDFKSQIVNAIGVMFHITNDEKWETALQNISNSLEKGGLLIVGGEFGEETKNLQFHKVDNYSSWEEKKKAWEEFKNTEDEEIMFNKRTRSKSHWIESCKKFDLELFKYIPGNEKQIVRTPQNNIMAFKKV